MKNTTITLKINPQLMPVSADNYDVKLKGRAVDCLNMRRKADASSAVLVPVGTPRVVTQGEYVPFFSFKHLNGEETLFMTASNLLCVKTSDAPLEQLALLPSGPLTAVAVGDKVCIMTQSGPVWTKYEKDKKSWTYMGYMPEFPVIRLCVKDMRQFSASTIPRQLMCDYTHWQGHLNDVDASVLSEDLKELYTSLASQAMQSGYYLQPVVVRYQLFDDMGVMLYESAPVLLSPPSGFQLTDSVISNVGVDGGKYCNVEGFSATATGFRIGIDAPELLTSPWREVVSKVKILISPQLHPIDYNIDASHRLENATATSGVLRAYLPGMACEMVADTPRREKLVKTMIAHFSSHEKTLAIINRPFSGGIVDGVTFEMVDYSDAEKDCRSLVKMLSESQLKFVADDYQKAVMRAISIPHSFSATTAINSGDVILWGGITPIRYGGYPIGMFTAETTNGEWCANIKVTFADGEETVVWKGEGNDNAPLSLLPILSYPHPDASLMTITVSYSDGVVRSRTFNLMPMGDMAIFIDTSFTPILLTDEQDAYVIPAVKIKKDFHSGTMLTSISSSPMHITSVLQATQGRIVAITPAVRSSSAWDFARTHLYAFSTAGIYAVAINSSRNVTAARLLDHRGVLSANAVVATDDAVVAIAGGDLVSVSGSRVNTLISASGFENIGWNMPYRELWCRGNGGEVKVISSNGTYRRDIKVNNMFTSLGGHLYLLSGGNLLDASVEERCEETEVYWGARMLSDEVVAPLAMHRLRLMRPQLISWHLFSSKADVMLSLRGDVGVGIKSSHPIIKMNVMGSLNAPIPARVIAPARQALVVEISGKVSADTHFNSVQLLLSK